MIRNKLFSVLFLTIGLQLSVCAQFVSTQLNHLTERLNSISRNAPLEMAYIQTDKDIYNPGEDIWFKVYLLDTKLLTPSVRSKTVYMQLLHENNKKVVLQEKFEIQKSFANGSLHLEGTLPDGDYLLAAYTANSFFDNLTEFKAIKKIRVKSEITFLPSLTANFDKPFYNEKDTIKIFLSPFSEQNDSLFAEISSTLQHGNEKIAKVQTIINGQRKVVVAFKPQSTWKDLNVAINIQYKDRKESLIMAVPCKGNPLQFSTFPEGGYLVSGIQSKLAFKAVNINGKPVDIAGTLFEDNTPLLKFISTHAGMGSFSFTPKNDKKYFIQLSQPNIDTTFSLPEIYPTGIIMSLVKRDENSISFKVSSNQGLEQEDIYLRVQCRGVVCGITSAKLTKELLIRIPLQELPQGIIEVTLFNSKLVPIVERLVYVNKERKLNIYAELSKNIYPTRGKATLKISVKDEYGQPVEANLGVSIFDKFYQNSLDSNNILSHAYLSTQLKGRIINPAYYFNGNTRNHVEALDLLMLTQGWRKYIWSENNMQEFIEAPEYIISDGTNGNISIRSLWKKVRLVQKFVIAYSPDKDKTEMVIPTDSAGKFTVVPGLLKRWEGDYVYLKPMGPSDSYPFIRLIDPFESINLVMRTCEIIYPITELMIPNEDISDLPEVIPGTITIKEVIIKGSNNNIQHGTQGKYMAKLANSDYVCIKNVLNCPRHVYGIDFRRPIIGETYYIIHNYNFKSEFSEKILYDSTFLQSFLYKKSIKLTHNFSEDELLKLNNLTRVKAYGENREFYMPNYDKVTEDAIIPDYRNTLLWNPSVFTDEKGEATLTFFCSDINTEFTGRIEGVSSDGLLGSSNFNLTVRKFNIIPK